MPLFTPTSVPTSAYLHVPFCLHKCGYCDFTVVAGRDDLTAAYLACMELEIRQYLAVPEVMTTLFLGGGTPTYLSAADLQALFVLVQRWLPLAPGGEFSVECNPEGFTPDRMDVLRSAGVNRISLGVQSFHPEHLRTLERSHSPDTVQTVIEQLRERELTNISLDLIFGVPGQTLFDWEKTLDRAIALKPHHLSTYGLTYEKGTSFWTRRARHVLKPVSEELEREMYALAMSKLPAQGFQHYEISNFALPGAECRHNRIYWRGESYYGFGPGAAGFRSGIRSMNHRSVTTWIKRLQQGDSAVHEEESLDTDLQRREAVMLGLRQIEGIDLADYQQKFGVAIRDLEPDSYARFLNEGWLEETATHIRLTRAGRFVADTVMSEFL